MATIYIDVTDQEFTLISTDNTFVQNISTSDVCIHIGAAQPSVDSEDVHILEPRETFTTNGSAFL